MLYLLMFLVGVGGFGLLWGLVQWIDQSKSGAGDAGGAS